MTRTKLEIQEENMELIARVKSLVSILNEKNNEIMHLKREVEYQKTIIRHVKAIKMLLEGNEYDSL